MTSDPKHVPPGPSAPGSGGRGASDRILLGFLLGLVGIAAATVTLLPRGPRAPDMSVIGASFRLPSSKGGVVDSASLAGRPYLVFFGFTQCPNVCPTTLADLGTLLDAMGAKGEEIRAYYVTVDPQRDTAAVLSEYMGSFSERITALTGTPEEIARVVRGFRAEVRKVPLAGGDYTFEHTMMIYIMDRRGGFVGPLSLDAGHGLAREQLRRVLAASPQG